MSKQSELWTTFAEIMVPLAILLFFVALLPEKKP